MKKKIEDVVEAIFSLSLIIAIIGGGIIFLMFVLALIIGGTRGEIIAVSASGTVMPYFIRAASISILSGLIYIYLNNEHALTMKD